ncbi:MAG TPA: hypothetical protein VGN95_07620 [Pyrinomonadaceae bacterium]|jgi:hypothetical protein|nr:hypothetical protein [Pyrinomonadaceae bacterium]
MKESYETNDEMTPDDSVQGDVGDVETAGETTAAAAITGPTDTSPVGADTMLKVADTHD